MNAHQRRQHAHMVECARLAASGEGHTPETRREFKTAVVRQQWRDEACRAGDFFDHIQSDNRPQSRAN